MTEEKEGELRRGPKGGRKHTPGRDHNRKSQERKKKRIGQRKIKRRQQREEEVRKQWKEYDDLPQEVKNLLGSKGEPKLPRPRNGT